MKNYSTTKKGKDGVERNKTLDDVRREIVADNPNTIITYKSIKYGHCWTGKAKFMLGALVRDAFAKEVQRVEVDEYGVTIFVR